MHVKLVVLRFRRYAVEHGLVGLLRSLGNRDGPLLQQGDFGYIASTVILGDHLGILRYVVFEYGLDINGIFSDYHDASSRINLLQWACNAGRLNSVELLLELVLILTALGSPTQFLFVSGSNSTI
jgi:hypothetical protein